MSTKTKTPETTPATKADRHMAAVKAGDRKAQLVKALRVAKATRERDAKTLEWLAGRLGWTRFDVYGLVNGTSGKAGSAPTCLTATGHVVVVKTEEGLAAYLTPKGAKTKYDEPPFVPAPRAKAEANGEK